MTKDEMIKFLKREVVPALGCTEPVCVALCCAYASSVLKGNIESVSVEVNSGIYKNGMSVAIPNCKYVGLHWAAALGAYLKNPEKSLEVFSDVTDEIHGLAEAFVNAGKVKVSLDANAKKLYAKCIIHSEEGSAVCIIQNAHNNVVYLESNGEVLIHKQDMEENAAEDSMITDLKAMKISEIRELVCSAAEEELEFLNDGILMNEFLAKYPEEHKLGLGISDTIRKNRENGLLMNDLVQRIVYKVASATESRLSGCPYPTMSSSGSGAKGIVAILPVSEMAATLGSDRLKTYQALALTHLLNRYINAYVGKIAPMCTCVVGAATAASAGMTFLLGGNDEQIGHAIRNMTGTVTGMICDGGKLGCTLKTSTGAFTAVMSALYAVNGAALYVSDGVCAETPEDCIKNIARIGNNGMVQADKEILNIMVEKNM